MFLLICFAVLVVKENIALLEVGKECLVYKFDVLRFILNIEFDDNFKNLKKIIFADPPYSYKYYTNLIEAISKINCVFILEHANIFNSKSLFSENLFLHKIIGKSEFTFYNFSR